MKSNTEKSKGENGMKVNVFLFNDFDALDVLGAVGTFGKMPQEFFIEFYSLNGDIVTSMQGMKIWTEHLTENISGDIFIVPGGKGARRFIRQDEDVRRLLKKAVDRAAFCIMIGNGSALLAQTGILYRRRICDYPMDENWNRIFTAGIYRQPDTKWVADGKFYSAVNAIQGVDMCLNILADIADLEAAEQTAVEIGYIWNPDDEKGIYR